MKGLIHIYTGEGKGKTTAGIGLSIRFAGSGGKVLYTQFLKDDSSSELNILSCLDPITFLPSGKNFGFTFTMTEETRQLARLHYQKHLENAIDEVTKGNYGLFVLDEIIGADNAGLISHDTLIDFLSHKPKQLEVVLTGRNPAADLKRLADYISDIQKVKHPFDKNIPARIGIEK